jgi:hypothetical protein
LQKPFPKLNSLKFRSFVNNSDLKIQRLQSLLLPEVVSGLGKVSMAAFADRLSAGLSEDGGWEDSAGGTSAISPGGGAFAGGLLGGVFSSLFGQGQGNYSESDSGFFLGFIRDLLSFTTHAQLFQQSEEMIFKKGRLKFLILTRRLSLRFAVRIPIRNLGDYGNIEVRRCVLT